MPPELLIMVLMAAMWADGGPDDRTLCAVGGRDECELTDRTVTSNPGP